MTYIIYSNFNDINSDQTGKTLTGHKSYHNEANMVKFLLKQVEDEQKSQDKVTLTLFVSYSSVA